MIIIIKSISKYKMHYDSIKGSVQMKLLYMFRTKHIPLQVCQLSHICSRQVPTPVVPEVTHNSLKCKQSIRCENTCWQNDLPAAAHTTVTPAGVGHVLSGCDQSFLNISESCCKDIHSPIHSHSIPNHIWITMNLNFLEYLYITRIAY
jgi:hypothetical protein